MVINDLLPAIGQAYLRTTRNYCVPKPLCLMPDQIMISEDDVILKEYANTTPFPMLGFPFAQCMFMPQPCPCSHYRVPDPPKSFHIHQLVGVSDNHVLLSNKTLRDDADVKSVVMACDAT